VVLADTFGASTDTPPLIAAWGALLAFPLSLVLSKLMLYFVGVVGAVVGAKPFVWATAFGGAAMALTGRGRLAPEQFEASHAPRRHRQSPCVRDRLAAAGCSGHDPSGAAAVPGSAS